MRNQKEKNILPIPTQWFGKTSLLKGIKISPNTHTGTARRTVGGGQCLAVTGEMKGWAEIGHKDLKYGKQIIYAWCSRERKDGGEK